MANASKTDLCLVSAQALPSPPQVGSDAKHKGLFFLTRSQPQNFPDCCEGTSSCDKCVWKDK